MLKIIHIYLLYKKLFIPDYYLLIKEGRKHTFSFPRDRNHDSHNFCLLVMKMLCILAASFEFFIAIFIFQITVMKIMYCFIENV